MLLRRHHVKLVSSWYGTRDYAREATWYAGHVLSTFTRFRPPNTPSRRPPTTNRAKSDSITGHLQSHRPRIRCLYATDSHCRHQACCCTASITEDSSRRSEHLKDATRLLPRAQWVACSQAPLMAEREGLMSCARHRIHLCHAAPTFLPTRWRLAPPWQRSARARRRQPVGRFLREMRPPSMRAIAGRRLVRRSGRAETAMGAQGGTRGPSWQPEAMCTDRPRQLPPFLHTIYRASLT